MRNWRSVKRLLKFSGRKSDKLTFPALLFARRAGAEYDFVQLLLRLEYDFPRVECRMALKAYPILVVSISTCYMSTFSIVYCLNMKIGQANARENSVVLTVVHRSSQY